jgi:hypothetical protein
MYTSLCNRWRSSTLFRENFLFVQWRDTSKDTGKNIGVCTLHIVQCAQLYTVFTSNTSVHVTYIDVRFPCWMLHHHQCCMLCYFLSIFSYFSVLHWLLLIVAFTHAYSIEPSPWEANRFSASQEIPLFFVEPGGSFPHLQVPATCCTHACSSVTSSRFYDTVVSIRVCMSINDVNMWL